MADASIKNIKTALADTRAKWIVNPRLKDTDEVPKYHMGGTAEGLPLTSETKVVDFKEVLDQLPGNPWLLTRRIESKILPHTVQTETAFNRFGIFTTPEIEVGTPEGGIPQTLDWRNRWGWPWITTVRNQDGCNACWAFAAVALVEAMVRIEHCVSPQLSEGDVHKGMGAKCANLGSSQAAMDWIATNGLADTGCFQWTTSDIAYAPCPDRSGRSVRCPKLQWVGSTDDQKKWLDTVGPLVTWFEVWTDFFTYGGGVYHKTNATWNKAEGGHFMLVVGYDEVQRCWIVKNSWKEDWGEHDYAHIGYGECGIDQYAKIGVRYIDPDPWTKRRQHNGTLLESSYGATHRNFEMVVQAAGKVAHWWRDNAVSGFPWHKGPTFANDVMSHPTLIQSTYDRNLECVYTTTAHRLHHWWRDQQFNWHDGGIFGPNDADGIPGLIQSNYGAPSNFELVVRTSDMRLNHWWRDGKTVQWHDGGRLADSITHSGATLIQSHYGTKDNFELVCVLNNGQMQHWWRDNDHGMQWNKGATFGAGVQSPPCMIEGSFGALDETRVGNFELCVAVNGKVQHWWRNNLGNMTWNQSATFGGDVQAVCGLLEGSFGFNLEVVVKRTDGRFQHYWRDGTGWHDGPIFGP